MSLAHWNSFLLLKKNNHPIHQRGDRCRPQTRRHICSAASPCWLLSRGGGEVPKVDVKHVKCYLPYLLVPLNIHEAWYWCQPSASRVETTGMSHSAVVTRAPSDIPEMLVHVTFFVCFLSRWWFAPEANNHFLFQFVCVGWRGGVLLSRSGTSQRRHPAMKKGGVGGGGERV